MTTENFIDERLALFVGAGASIAPPSNLPSFYTLRNTILSELLNGLSSSDLPEKQTIAAATKPELLLQVIWDYYGDSVNPVSGFRNVPCNTNHYLIAETCNRGVRLIITTNFDQCIENALDTQKIRYLLFPSCPTNEKGLIELREAIIESPDVVIWKPHGDCVLPQTLCYTMEKVASLNGSKFLKTIFNFILKRFSLLTLGYSGYDDDFFPLIYDFPLNDQTSNRIFWNSYEEPVEDSPPYNLSKRWNDRFSILKGDMQHILQTALVCSVQAIPPDVKQPNDSWEDILRCEIEKVPVDGRVAILGQYNHRLQFYDNAISFWRYGLKLQPLSKENYLRFSVNTVSDDYEKLKSIYAVSLSLESYDIASVALIKIISLYLSQSDYLNAKIYLKQYRQISSQHPEIVHDYEYFRSLKEYLQRKYRGNNRKINTIVQQLAYRIFETSFQVGDIIESINALKDYVSQVAEADHIEAEKFHEVLKFAPMLESYNLPFDMGGLYWAIASAAIRLDDRDTSWTYIGKCEAQVIKCRDSGLYESDRFHELMANILHHKSMLGDAETAIPICKEALDHLNAIENRNTVSPNIDSYIGLFNSSIAANYLILRRYQESEEFSKIAIEHHRKAFDLRGEAGTLLTLAETYYRTDRKVEAEEAAEECLQKHIKVGQNTKRIEKLLQEFRTPKRRSFLARAVDWIRASS